MMMSLTEDVTSQTSESLARHSVLAEDLSQDGLTSLGAPGARVLLVWDAPNLDMGLGSILGRRPTALERPRFDALGRWLLARTAEIVAGVQASRPNRRPPSSPTSPLAAPRWSGRGWTRCAMSDSPSSPNRK